MKHTRLFAVLFVILALAGPASVADAASLGIQIIVAKNGVTVGTAFGGVIGAAPGFIVTVAPGDTLRFTVQLDQSATFTSFNTTIVTDDPTEIDFVNGSAVSLSGKAFTVGGNPNTNLNDITPAVGAAAIPGTGGSVTSQDLYRLDYTVQAGVVSDATSDIRVTLATIGGNTVNTTLQEAAVRVDLQAPEPASVLLLGVGLIPLVRIFGKRRG